MLWPIFLHIYQPANQQEEILEAVVNQSYRPLLKGLLQTSNVGITLNVTGTLLEQLDHFGFHDVLDMLVKLGDLGIVEFTGSAKYHAFLPLLPINEIIRQITINDETCRFYLGKSFSPVGFFPPEMGYSGVLIPILSDLGYKWCLIDEIAYSGLQDTVSYDRLYRIQNSKLNVFFRNRRISNSIMSAIVRNSTNMVDVIGDELHKDIYLLTAMDGETFGHHRPGLEKLLFNILNDSSFSFVTISNLLFHFNRVEEVTPIASTWASTAKDIEDGNQFLSWKDPDNEIHAWQWEFLAMVLDCVNALDKSSDVYLKTRGLMDIAMSSDHFWWASAKPWWSVEMVEYGAFNLLSVIRSIPNISDVIYRKAETYYETIVSTAFSWQRSGKIRKMSRDQREFSRIPFKERTLEQGGEREGIYYAFVDLMYRLEKKAALAGEYEQAILWRDAIYKLEKKNDIYDSINAIDLLRQKIDHTEVEETIVRYKDIYRRLKGGQPEQRGN